MKKETKIENKTAYSSPELDAFLALEDTINTDYIRTSMLLAAQIEDAMKAKGIGKKQFADLLGKKPSVITKWLSGTHNFEIHTLTQIATALNIKLFAFDVPNDKETIILKPNLTYEFKMDTLMSPSKPAEEKQDIVNLIITAIQAGNLIPEEWLKYQTKRIKKLPVEQEQEA